MAGYNGLGKNDARDFVTGSKQGMTEQEFKTLLSQNAVKCVQVTRCQGKGYMVLADGKSLKAECQTVVEFTDLDRVGDYLGNLGVLEFCVKQSHGE